jgi:hypothetical protein
MMIVRLPIDVQTAHSHTAEEEGEEADSKMVMAEELSCPICLTLMTDPVVAEDGQTYQRQAIEEWIHKCITGTAPENKWDPVSTVMFLSSLNGGGQCMRYTDNPCASPSDGRGAPGDVTTHGSRDGIVSATQCTGEVTGARLGQMQTSSLDESVDGGRGIVGSVTGAVVSQLQV